MFECIREERRGWKGCGTRSGRTLDDIRQVVAPGAVGASPWFPLGLQLGFLQENLTEGTGTDRVI